MRIVKENRGVVGEHGLLIDGSLPRFSPLKRLFVMDSQGMPC